MRYFIFIVITFCLQNYKKYSNRPTLSCNTNYCSCNIPTTLSPLPCHFLEFAYVFRPFAENICCIATCFVPLHQKSNKRLIVLGSYSIKRLVVFKGKSIFLGIIGARREDGPQWFSARPVPVPDVSYTLIETIRMDRRDYRNESTFSADEADGGRGGYLVFHSI